MVFSCPICSESLEKRAGETRRGNEVNVSCAPCGHLFHTYCINKWMTGTMQTSKKCPYCRKDIPGMRVLSLFPTLSDDSMAGEVNCDHLEQMEEMNEKIKVLEETAIIDNARRISLDERCKTLDTICRREQAKTEVLTLKWKKYESYKDLCDMKEAQFKEMEDKLKKYEYVEGLLKGQVVTNYEECLPTRLTTQMEWNKAVQDFIKIKQALLTEINLLNRKLSDTKTESGRLRNELTSYKSKAKILRRKYEALKRSATGGSSDLNLTHSFTEPGPSSRLYSNSPLSHGLNQMAPPPPATMSKNPFLKEGSKKEIDRSVDILSPLFGQGRVAKSKAITSQTRKRTLSDNSAQTKPLKKKITTKPTQLAVIPQSSQQSNNTIVIESSDSEMDDDVVSSYRVKSSIPGISPVDRVLPKPLQSKFNFKKKTHL